MGNERRQTTATRLPAQVVRALAYPMFVYTDVPTVTAVISHSLPYRQEREGHFLGRSLLRYHVQGSIESASCRRQMAPYETQVGSTARCMHTQRETRQTAICKVCGKPTSGSHRLPDCWSCKRKNAFISVKREPYRETADGPGATPTRDKRWRRQLTVSSLG